MSIGCATYFNPLSIAIKRLSRLQWSPCRRIDEEVKEAFHSPVWPVNSRQLKNSSVYRRICVIAANLSLTESVASMTMISYKFERNCRGTVNQNGLTIRC